MFHPNNKVSEKGRDPEKICSTSNSVGRSEDDCGTPDFCDTGVFLH